MTWRAVLGVIVVVGLIIFAPIFLADGIERFFTGLGVMFSRWTD